MLPDGWKRIKLGKIAGTVTSGSRDWAQYYADSGALFIRMTNLSREGIHLKLSDLKFVDINSNSSDGKRTKLEHGDILISITAELGKIGWVPEGLGEAYINQHTALVRVDSNKADSKYIAYLLSSRKMNYVINRMNDSGAKAGLNLPTIKSIPLEIPTFAEQRRITSILSTWDSAIESVEKLIENSQKQKKALMQQLLSGKKRLPGFTEEWSKTEFRNIASLSKKKYDPTKDIDSYLCVELEHLSQGTGQCLGSIDSKQQLSAKTVFNKGDILFGKLRPYLRKYWLSTINGVCSTEIWALRANKKACSQDYLFHLVQTEKFIQACNVSSGSRMPRADWSYVSEIPFELPNIAEQKEISAILNKTDTTLSNLNIQHEFLISQKNALMQQLLTGERRVKLN